MGDIRPLTSLRGIAAAMVAWGHFHLEFPAPHRITLFVDLFFILSGFVIMLAYKDRMKSPIDYVRFLGLRLGRIYPVHLVTLAAAVLAIGYVNAMRGRDLFYWRDTLDSLWRNLTLTQAWPGVENYSWNMPAWSISVEWAAYLAFPLFLFLSRRLGAAFILLVIAGYAGFWHLRDGASSFGTGWQWGLHRCLLGFALGVWLYSVRPQAGRVAGFLYGDGVVFASMVAVAAVWLVPLPDWYVIAPMALLILSLSGNKGVAARVMGLPVLHGLGLISYSLYMVHYPVYKLWQQYHRMAFPDGMSDMQMLAMGGLCAVLVLIASTVCWYLVEEPCRKASKVMLRPRDKAAGSVDLPVKNAA
ncbi:acyltransferase [Henriciella sp.]|uniref:acyltransferase family protein n=1 Tax=Henriciella sp. TaxID=1968823 RepID=UPI002625C1B3|nr:acyltransferase [Henriciella sp.]